MIFIAATDLHLASKPPASRIDADFPEELFELLEQLLQVAIATQAKAILFPGDITHVRTRLDWATLGRFFNWCLKVQANGTDVVGIPGNHDLLLNRYDTLDDTPLGLLFKAGAMKNVSVTQGQSYAEYYCGGDEGAPELVHVVGVPFPDAFSLDAWRKLEHDDHRHAQVIVLGHCFANLMPSTFYGDPVHGYAELLEASGADYIVLGHDHTDRGVHKFLGDRYVLDVGALCRGSSSTDNITRELKFCVIDTTTRSVTPYRFHYRPADQLFDLDAKAKLAVEAAQVQSFVSRLQDDLQAQASGTSVEQKLTGMSLPAAVRDRVLAYIEAAEQAQDDALAG